MSEVGDFVGEGFGVLSGSGVAFFLSDDFPLADLVFAPAFFFADFDFEVADGVFEGLVDGVGRSDDSCSLSASTELLDLFTLPADFFDFLGADSSSSDFDLVGVFDGFGVACFFFFGVAVGVGDVDFSWLLRDDLRSGLFSSVFWPCRNDDKNAVNARPVARQRRMRATAAHRNRVGEGFKPAEAQPLLLWHVPVRAERWHSVFRREGETNR